MQSPVEMEEIDQDHHQKAATNLRRESMDCDKQQDNSGKSLWKQ